MFQIGDIVKRVNHKADRNQYRIKSVYEMPLDNGDSLKLYAIVDVKSGKREYYGMLDLAMELDKNYYRKMKIDKICQKQRKPFTST